MLKVCTMMRFSVIGVFVLATLSGSGQVPAADQPSRTGAKVEAVQYLYPEQVTVPAGKASQVALHFRIKQGLHINSHQPKDEFLIPTVFSIPDSSGVRLEAADYPPGVDFVLPVDPGTKLVVYTGEFTIQTRIVAQAGDDLVGGKVHYQA